MLASSFASTHVGHTIGEISRDVLDCVVRAFNSYLPVLALLRMFSHTLLWLPHSTGPVRVACMKRAGVLPVVTELLTESSPGAFALRR